jgi:hypothetical protein
VHTGVDENGFIHCQTVTQSQVHDSQERDILLLGTESPFATDKRLDGLARTRVMGVNKNLTFYGLAAMASNRRKRAEVLTLYGVRRSVPTG